MVSSLDGGNTKFKPVCCLLSLASLGKGEKKVTSNTNPPRMSSRRKEPPPSYFKSQQTIMNTSGLVQRFEQTRHWDMARRRGPLWFWAIRPWVYHRQYVRRRFVEGISGGYFSIKNICCHIIFIKRNQIQMV